ncbi:MAG: hypothetical protein WC809_19980, partial [Sinimarinibacterium sp.]
FLIGASGEGWDDISYGLCNRQMRPWSLHPDRLSPDPTNIQAAHGRDEAHTPHEKNRGLGPLLQKHPLPDISR